MQGQPLTAQPKISDIDLDLETIAPVLDPYVVERMPLDSERWRDYRAGLEKRWRRRRWRRAFFGWLPKGGNIPRVLRGRRTQDYVRQSYEQTFAARAWPETTSVPPRKELVPAEWRGEGLLVRRGGLPRVHLMLMARAIEALQPRSVLEVGAGHGINLFVLSCRFPEITWQGIELTTSGVQRAQTAQQSEAFPDALRAYCPWDHVDETAYRRIEFRQGDATKLPFEDKAFDLVFSRQAVEQMEMVRDAALSEITRVARDHVLMVEPFADFNRSALQRNYVRAKDYFNLPVAGLADFGIAPVLETSSFPQHVLLGQGLVVSRVN
ncbi:MAG: class I SAM-dependent methyltransferase [Rhodospirillales bacterium]|nr:class I SAM-dependent methyltransferase [Rhodospirillales bacterium]MDH3965881.1 class I SAM-dependent methyltransferase [Rhodospirillales bacterium]